MEQWLMNSTPLFHNVCTVIPHITLLYTTLFHFCVLETLKTSTAQLFQVRKLNKDNMYLDILILLLSTLVFTLILWSSLANILVLGVGWCKDSHSRSQRDWTGLCSPVLCGYQAATTLNVFNACTVSLSLFQPLCSQLS